MTNAATARLDEKQKTAAFAQSSRTNRTNVTSGQWPWASTREVRAKQKGPAKTEHVFWGTLLASLSLSIYLSIVRYFAATTAEREGTP